MTQLRSNIMNLESKYRLCIKYSPIFHFYCKCVSPLYPLIGPMRSDALSVRLHEGTESFGQWKFLGLASDQRENRLQCPARVSRLVTVLRTDLNLKHTVLNTFGLTWAVPRNI